MCINMSYIIIIIVILFLIYQFTNGREYITNGNLWVEDKPNWYPDEWSESSNCYSYSYNDNRYREWSEQQPGLLSNMLKIKNDDYTCIDINNRILNDDSATRIVDCENMTCPQGTHKIALAVDPTNDYHFYRQDADGTWSHKLGTNKPQRLDDTPWNANRDYGSYNYKDFCGCYCVKSDGNLEP